jgi:HlyD family secretion protein
MVRKRVVKRWATPLFLAPLAAAAVLLTPGRGDSQAKKEAAEAPAAQKAPESSPVHTVGTADLTRTIQVTGELRAAKSRDIYGPRIRSGFASAVTFLVLEGTPVKQGQRIVEFDASALESQQAEAERKLNEANLKIAKTKADLEAQRSDLLIALAQAQGNLKVAQLYGKIEKELLPSNTYQKYQLDLEKAQLALTKAQDKLNNLVQSITPQVAITELEKAQAEIELKKINSDLQLLAVDAPQDGIIVYGDNWASNRKVQVGDNIFPGMAVVRIPDMSSLQVVGYVYDTELRFLSKGMVCEISLDSIPGKVWRGKIESLTSVANRKGFASKHKVFQAIVQPDDVDANVMKPGMTARIEVTVSLGSGMLAIPREYLGLHPTGRYYVLKGTDPKRATVQNVEVGRFSDSMVEIVSGVEAGTQIVSPYTVAEVKS